MYVRILTLRRDAVHCCLVSHTIQRNPSLHLTSLQCSVPLFRTDSAGCDSSPLPRGVLNDGQTDRPLDKWRPSMLRMLILLLCSALLCSALRYLREPLHGVEVSQHYSDSTFSSLSRELSIPCACLTRVTKNFFLPHRIKSNGMIDVPCLLFSDIYRPVGMQ